MFHYNNNMIIIIYVNNIFLMKYTQIDILTTVPIKKYFKEYTKYVLVPLVHPQTPTLHAHQRYFRPIDFIILPLWCVKFDYFNPYTILKY